MSAYDAAPGSWVTITIVWRELVDGAAQEGEDLATGAAVEVAGRLVGEDHRRPSGERAGDGDALLLAARQFARAVVQAVAEPDGVDDGTQPRPVRLAAGEVHRQRDVLDRRERGQEVERLEHESDPFAAQLGQLAVGELGEIDVTDVHGSGRERVEPGEAVHQRALAGAGRAHHGGERAGGYPDRHVIEREHLGGAASVGLHGVLDAGRDRAGRRERPGGRRGGCEGCFGVHGRCFFRRRRGPSARSSCMSAGI